MKQKILKLFNFLVDINWRVNRLQYLYSILWLFLLIPLLILLLSISEINNIINWIIFILSSTFFIILFLLVFNIVRIKRLHDLWLSWYWSLLCWILFPFSDILLLIIPGKKEKNKYDLEDSENFKLFNSNLYLQLTSTKWKVTRNEYLKYVLIFIILLIFTALSLFLYWNAYINSLISYNYWLISSILIIFTFTYFLSLLFTIRIKRLHLNRESKITQKNTNEVGIFCFSSIE